MIPIQVLGSGLIPRGYGLAPRKEPFKADKTLIFTIMQTPGLKVNFINPETGAPTELTRTNVNRIYAQWANYKPTEKKSDKAPQLGPKVPERVEQKQMKNTSSFREETVSDQLQVEGSEKEDPTITPTPADETENPDPVKPSIEENFGELQGVEVQPGNLTDPPAEIKIELHQQNEHPSGLMVSDDGPSLIKEDPKEEEVKEDAESEAGGVSDEKGTEEVVSDEKPRVSFKPILNDDEKPAQPTSTTKPYKNNKHKHR